MIPKTRGKCNGFLLKILYPLDELHLHQGLNVFHDRFLEYYAGEETVERWGPTLDDGSRFWVMREEIEQKSFDFG